MQVGFTVGALAVVTPGWGQRPNTSYPNATVTSGSNVFEDKDLLVDLNLDGAFTPARERYGAAGEQPLAVAWLCFTSDSGAKTDKSEVSGITCYLEAP